MTIRLRKPAAGKNTAVICNYPYCPRTKRSKVVQHGLLDIKSNPNLLPTGIRMTSDYVLTEEDLEYVRSWLAKNGTYKEADGYEALRSSYELLYAQLSRQWQQLIAKGALQKDFQPAWRRVQDIQEAFKSKLQALGAVKTLNKIANTATSDSLD